MQTCPKQHRQDDPRWAWTTEESCMLCLAERLAVLEKQVAGRSAWCPGTIGTELRHQIRKTRQILSELLADTAAALVVKSLLDLAGTKLHPFDFVLAQKLLRLFCKARTPG